MNEDCRKSKKHNSQNNTMVNYNFSLKKSKLLGKFSGFNSIISKASDYWENTMSDIGKTMCNCGTGKESEFSLFEEEKCEENIQNVENVENNENLTFIEKAKCGNKPNNNFGENSSISNNYNNNLKSSNFNNNEKQFEYNNEINKNSNPAIANPFLSSNPFPLEEKRSSLKQEISPYVQISETTNEIYNHFNDPSNNRRIWTKEEDELLLDFMKKSPSRNWKKISQILKTKTPQQCTYRYNKLIEELTKRKWTRTEDIKLIELIEVYGTGSWEAIAAQFENRTAKDVEDRFTKKLDPNLKKSRFTEEEDELLIKLHEKLGNQWFEIAKHFKNRTVLMIKNRFYSFLRRKIIKENLANYNSLCSASFTNETASNKQLSLSGNNADALSYSNASETNIVNMNNSVAGSRVFGRETKGFDKVQSCTSLIVGNSSKSARNSKMFEIVKKSDIALDNEVYSKGNMLQNNSPFDLKSEVGGKSCKSSTQLPKFSDQVRAEDGIFEDFHVNQNYDEYEIFMKNNTYNETTNHNESLLFQDFNQFGAKHYSFPNEEPFFNEEDQHLNFFDDGRSGQHDVSMLNSDGSDPNKAYPLKNNNPFSSKPNNTDYPANKTNINSSNNNNLNESYLEDFHNIIKGMSDPQSLITSLNANSNITSLFKQMNNMDGVTEKVLQFYTNKNRDLLANVKKPLNEKFVLLNNQIDERFAVIHNQILTHYKERNSLKPDVENTRNYIKKQIELLIQLIYSTKLKVKLFHTLNVS